MKLDGASLIAVTGGIGSGKSRVSRYWAACAGLPLIDIDAICAKLLEKGNAGWQAIRDELGNDYFLPGGSLNRKMLRCDLFADEGIRQRVNALMHPLARQKMNETASRLRGRDVLVDVPLLFEAGWEESFDRLVVVYACAATCCRRVAGRDRITPVEAGQAMHAQFPMEEKVMRADHVVNNSGNWTSTVLEIRHLASLTAALARGSVN
jgi:dephospho-CoA kinase